MKKYKMILPPGYRGPVSGGLWQKQPDGSLKRVGGGEWHFLPDGRIEATITREELELVLTVHQIAAAVKG